MYIHTYIYIYTHTHIYIHTHTYIHKRNCCCSCMFLCEYLLSVALRYKQSFIYENVAKWMYFLKKIIEVDSYYSFLAKRRKLTTCRKKEKKSYGIISLSFKFGALLYNFTFIYVNFRLLAWVCNKLGISNFIFRFLANFWKSRSLRSIALKIYVIFG